MTDHTVSNANMTFEMSANDYEIIRSDQCSSLCHQEIHEHN